MKILIILTLLICGCSSVSPYAELTAGYTFNQQIYQDQYQDCNYAFHGKVGVETRKGLSIGLAHDSNIDCGPPFDTRKEPFRDYFYITKKFGGFSNHGF